MAELFDKEGNLVDNVFTQEELDAKLSEERTKAIEDANADRQEEIDKLNEQITTKEKELETAKEELTKEKDKDKNLGGQRKIIEAKEKEVEDLKTKVSEIEKITGEKITKIEGEIKDRTISQMIEVLAPGDKDLADKIKFHYDNFKGEPKDLKEIQQRIENAYVLATGGRPQNPLTGEVISSSGGVGPKPSGGGKVSEEVMDVAKKMGITEQEMKKHKLI